MNPILQRLNRGNQSNMSGILEMLRAGNPTVIYNQMLRSNPQFAKFVRDNKGKTPEQIASAYGIDINSIINRFGAQSRSK